MAKAKKEKRKAAEHGKRRLPEALRERAERVKAGKVRRTEHGRFQ